MMGRAFLLCALLLSSGSASAWRLDLTQTFVGEAHFDNGDRQGWNDDFQLLREKLNVALSHGIYRFQGRFEGAVFMGLPDQGAAPDPFENVYEPEKLTLTVRAGKARIELGDHYQTLGRGFLLSLKRMDELGLDTSLRGARMDYRDEILLLTTFGGFTNTVNLDSTSWKRLDDPNDLIAGGRLGVRLPFGLEVAGQGLVLSHRRDFPPENDHAAQQTWGVGGTLDWPSIGAYAEFDYLRRQDVIFLPENELAVDYQDESDDAYAAFLGWVKGLGPVTVLAEAKWQHDFALMATPGEGDGTRGVAAVPYNTPPTLERDGLPISPHESGLGGRVKLSFTLEALHAVAHAGYTRYLDPPGEVSDHADIESIDHGFINWEQHLMNNRVSAELTGGFRHEAKKAAQPDFRLWYVEGKLSLPLAAGHSLDLIAQHLDFLHDASGPFLEDEAYMEGTTGLTYTLFTHVLLSAALDYSTSPSYDREWFPSGSVEWKYSGASSIKALYGMYRGGLRCVGGVCRLLPPFNGAWLQWVHRF
jgi:hypothetical protein